MRRNLVLALSLAAAVGCSAASVTGGDARADQQAGGTPVPVTRLRPGYTFTFSSGYTAPARQVVRSEAEWRTVWARLHESVMPQPPVPAIDFSRETVLVAALGQRSSGGFSILVDSVYDAGSTLRAVVRRSSPGAGCTVTAALTQPVDVVRIPAGGRGVGFVDRDEVRDCR
ncbi:MAG: protease complex subunit PrcB family protein [Gemmatimonadota bacterium]